MAIKAFKRVPNYFAGFSKLRADSLDSQFNMISSYLNDEVVTVLNKLSSDKIVGSTNPADANKFLQNVGDTTTRWSAIDNDSFSDYSLSLAKLVKTNIGSILAANSSGVIEPVSTSTTNQILSSRSHDLPIWTKIQTPNIADRSITGDSIADATITNDNLPAYLIENLIIEDSITGDKFKNNSITSTKIADNVLTAEKLHPNLATPFAKGVWNNIIPDNYLTTVNQILKPQTYGFPASWETMIRLFNDRSRPVTKYTNSKPTINTVLPVSKFSNNGYFFGFGAPHVYGRIRSATKLKDNSVDAVKVAVGYNPSSSAYPRDMRIFIRDYMYKMVQAGAVQKKHLTPYLRNKLENA